MKLNFLIDDREHSQELKDALKIVSMQRMFDYETSHLEIGDVQCGNVVIERKEARDFIGSIMDRRLSEQAKKMMYAFEHRYIIIEGDIYSTGSMISDVAIIGKLTSLCVKYGIGLIYVKSPLHFVEACYSIVKKHQDTFSFDGNFVPSSIPKRTDEEILVMMLMTIKGISYDKSKAICEMYGNSFRCIVDNADPKQISSIDGIGKVLANRICDFVKK